MSQGSLSYEGAVGRAPVLPDVIQEHLEELAFLSVQRRKLLFASDVSLPEFLPHDDRIAAHWDGLVVGRPASVEIAKGRLDEFDPWDTYVAARVWIELGDPTGEEIAVKLEETNEEAQSAWREALRRVPRDRLQRLLPRGPDVDGPPGTLSTLVFAWGWHGILAPELVPTLAFSVEPAVRVSIARALGWSGVHASLLEALITDPEIEVKRAATWSEALLNPKAAVSRCRTTIESNEADPFSVRVLGLLGGLQDVDVLVRTARRQNELGTAGIRALGDLGNVAAMDTLIEIHCDEDEERAEAAGGAMAVLLGGIPEAASGPEQPETETLEPNQPDLRDFWLESSQDYSGTQRWLRGRPFPWRGPTEDEPMEALWRSSLLAPRPELNWLRLEVPDGFFTGGPELEAITGV